MFKHKLIDSACYKCPDRKVTENYNCHSDCPKYAIYKINLEKAKTEENEFGNTFVDHKYGTYKKPWRPKDGNY